MKDVGVYVHIPFCKQKCYYCDFKSYSDKNMLIEEYIKWLLYEIEQVGQGNKMDYNEKLDDLVCIKTIYIGGGTPSIIDSKYITQILKKIKENFCVSDSVEITIEINPGTVNEQKLQDYFDCGINRISIGLQETNDELLKLIGRIHTYDQFETTYKLARKVGFKNINVDLMIGLPNQNLENVKSSLEKIIKLDPEHISVYSLILEDETKLNQLVQSNIISLPNEDIERDMYWYVKETLEKNFYKHYEISNFSKKGFESAHNLDCWNQKEYMGFGVASHSYTNDVRFSNIDNIEEYIKNYQNGKEVDNLIFHEKQNKISKMKEFILLGLRKIDGIKISDFKNKFVDNPVYLYRDQLQKLVNDELIEIDEDYIKLTKKGIDFANLVWEEFV